MKKITFLVSGNGGTLKFLVEAIESLQLPFSIVEVIADRNCGAVTYAESKNIVTKVFDFKNDGWKQLQTQLHEKKPDIVITTFHKIIPKNILDIIPNGFVNLHYSLLPAYKGYIGMKTVQEAKKHNVQFIGATAHTVNEQVDAGKILAQCCYAVNWEQEITAIYDIIFKNACIILLNALHIIANFEENNNVELNSSETIVSYNPPLHFDSKKFDTTFWSKIN